MKKPILSLGILSLLMCSTIAHAAFVSGSTGALGAYNPTGNDVITLPPDGVLNYTTINIPSGATVTFTKNAANTPVYMLASGDVIIAGTINVSGTNGTSNDIGKGGAGGFNGGYGGGIAMPGGNGLGPGGGNAGPYLNSNHFAGGGGFGAVGNSGGSNIPGAGGIAYGNSRLLPLIGGSGGGGGGGTLTASGYPGGGGGGAVVIASSTQITLTGSILANGGSSISSSSGGGGSGGGVKLISGIISGNGTINAAGGIGCGWGGFGGIGGVGRIRIEATTNNRTAGTNPACTYGLPITVFPTNPPTLNITSIGGTNAPASSTGAYNQPDITLPSNTPNPVVVNVAATNIPLPNSVTITVIPQFIDATATSASPTLSGTDQASTASASVTLSTAYANVVTAQATFTVVAMYYDGEEIDKVRVAATLGGKSETTYITKSGKEIKGELVAALMK